MKNKFRGNSSIKRSLFSLASQQTDEAFHSLFHQLPQDMQRLLERIELTSWAFFATKKPALGQRTSNAAESMNSTLSGIRELQPLSICLEIYRYTMVQLAKRRQIQFESISALIEICPPVVRRPKGRP
jgi:hypothetical protein